MTNGCSHIFEFAGYAITAWLNGQAMSFTIQLEATAGGGRMYKLPNSARWYTSVEALVGASMGTSADPAFGKPLVLIPQFR